MHFKILGAITNVESIAAGTDLRERKRLWKAYGKGRWKVKGTADGTSRWHDLPCGDSLV